MSATLQPRPWTAPDLAAVRQQMHSPTARAAALCVAGLRRRPSMPAGGILRKMGRDDEALAAWDRRLRAAEDELSQREQHALADDPSPAELVAFAAERDRLALDRDAIAERYDDLAGGRDLSALRRDVGGSERDRHARAREQDEHVAWQDRFAAGEDRDFAAGDRADSHDDRRRARAARERAAEDREHAAADRDQAAQHAAKQDEELAGLRAALESRLVTGQAQGLLMARHDVSSECAFRILVRLSQGSNTKLREVAAQLVASADATVNDPVVETEQG